MLQKVVVELEALNKVWSYLDNFAPVHVKLRKQATTAISVTRLGDLLDFGQLIKAFGNN